MMFGLAKPVPAAPPPAGEDDVTTSDDVEAELAVMRTEPKPVIKVNKVNVHKLDICICHAILELPELFASSDRTDPGQQNWDDKKGLQNVCSQKIVTNNFCQINLFLQEKVRTTNI